MYIHILYYDDTNFNNKSIDSASNNKHIDMCIYIRTWYVREHVHTTYIHIYIYIYISMYIDRYVYIDIYICRYT